MVLKLCRCGQITSNRPAVCDACRDRADDSRRETTRYYDTKLRNKQADAFYHSKAWKVSRLAYLTSIGFLCEDCVAEWKRGERRAEDIQLATDVHHKEPIAINWARRLDPNNYRGLCDGHHKQQRVHKLPPGGGQNSTG